MLTVPLFPVSWTFSQQVERHRETSLVEFYKEGETLFEDKSCFKDGGQLNKHSRYKYVTFELCDQELGSSTEK